MGPPEGDGETMADLVLDDGVSDILGKLTHNAGVRFILLVSFCMGLLQNSAQLVLDPFEGSVTILVSGCS